MLIHRVKEIAMPTKPTIARIWRGRTALATRRIETVCSQPINCGRPVWTPGHDMTSVPLDYTPLRGGPAPGFECSST